LSIYKAFLNYKNGIEERASFANKQDTAPSPKETVSKVIALPAIDISKQDTGAENTQQIEPADNQTVEFMVQISSSKNSIPLNSNYFKGLKNVEELKITDGYKYAVGRKPSYEQIQEYMKVIKNYFPDAFIIALKNGKIIPVKEALKEIKD